MPDQDAWPLTGNLAVEQAANADSARVLSAEAVHLIKFGEKNGI